MYTAITSEEMPNQFGSHINIKNFVTCVRKPGLWAVQYFWSAIRTPIHKFIGAALQSVLHSTTWIGMLIGVLHSTPHSNPSSTQHNPIQFSLQILIQTRCNLACGVQIGVTRVDCRLERWSGKYALRLGTPPCGVRYCGVPFCTPS